MAGFYVLAPFENKANNNDGGISGQVFAGALGTEFRFVLDLLPFDIVKLTVSKWCF